MANVRYLRKLPQRYGLTGMSTRTPIEEKISGRRSNIPSVPHNPPSSGLVALAEEKEKTRRVTSPPVLTNFSDLGGGPGPDGKGEAPSGNSLSESVGNQIAGTLAGKGVKGGLMTAAKGALLNIPAEELISPITKSSMFAALSPFAVASTVGGGLVAAELGQNAANEAVEQGYTLSPTAQGKVAAAGSKAVGSSLLGQAARGLASLVTKAMSPEEIANEAASQEAAMQHVEAQSRARSPYTNFEAIQSDFEGINKDIAVPQAFGTSEGLSAAPASPAVAAAAPNVTGQVTGLFESGPAATQGEAPVGVGGTTGQSPTGHGDDGAADSIGGLGGGGAAGASAYGGGETGDVGGISGGDGGAGPGGTVICTELHRQGLMPDHIYKADSDYGDKLPDSILQGYYVIGRPIARLMARSPMVTAVIKPVCLSWAYHMAHKEGVVDKPNKVGAAIERFGIPLCKVLFSLKCVLTRKSSRSQRHPVSNVS